MKEFNSESVVSTLQHLVKILETNNIEYRVLGSVVISAINGRLHRNLGDIDLIISSQGKDILYSKLRELGYRRAGGIFTFARKYLSLETLRNPKLIEVGYFYGDWGEDGSFLMGKRNVKVTIDAYAVKKTKYKLNEVEFYGIPKKTSATGVKFSEKNPKRKKELTLLREKNIKPFPNKFIHINVFGMRFDWIYHLTMAVLNIIGGVRVKLGLAFDPWR